MREAHAEAQLDQLVAAKNFVGARLFVRRAEIDETEREELLGKLAASVVDELSRTRRDDRERLAYLRGVLAWVTRDVPGLGSLYREQVRLSLGRTDFFTEVAKGIRNVGDVAGGRKSFQEGVQDAGEGIRRNLEEAGDRLRSDESGARVSDFFSAAERGVRDGLDQIGDLFRRMNGGSSGSTETESEPDSKQSDAAGGPNDSGVEDAEFQADGESVDEPVEEINVERE